MVLAPQPLDLIALLAAQQVLAPPLIRFDPAHVFAQRLRRDPKITPNMRNRPARLENQPRRSLQQLLGILPRSRHPQRPLPPPKTGVRSLRQTQDGSDRQRRRRRLTLTSASHPCKLAMSLC